jgi:hypothetical protein
MPATVVVVSSLGMGALPPFSGQSSQLDMPRLLHGPPSPCYFTRVSARLPASIAITLLIVPPLRWGGHFADRAEHCCELAHKGVDCQHAWTGPQFSAALATRFFRFRSAIRPGAVYAFSPSRVSPSLIGRQIGPGRGGPEQDRRDQARHGAASLGQAGQVTNHLVLASLPKFQRRSIGGLWGPKDDAVRPFGVALAGIGHQ